MKTSTRLLERLAVQAQQPRMSAPAPMPRASMPPQGSRPSGAPARPAPAPAGQGRAARPAVPPSNGKLTLGEAVPPGVAARIAQVRAAATPAPAPEHAKPQAPRRVAETPSQRNQKSRPDRQQPQPARSEPTSTKPKHDGPHPIERLAAMYPVAFDVHRPLPLAIGIAAHIATTLGVHPRVAKAVLGRWTGRVNYLSAMSAPGSCRFNLDGSVAGEVTEEHRAIAVERLAQKTAVTLAPDTPDAMAVGSDNSSAGKERREMPRITTTARRLKVTAVVDVSAFADLRVSDNATPRSEVTVNVNGRQFKVDIATKSLRRAVATVAEHGADNVAIVLQGVLGPGDEITEAGLVAQPKAPAKAAAA